MVSWCFQRGYNKREHWWEENGLKNSLKISCYKYTSIIFPFSGCIHFHQQKKHPQERSKWQKLINRSSPSKNRKGSLFTIKSKMRVCSKHFIDKEPTYEHPYPTEELGYDPSHRLSTLVDSNVSHSQRKLLYTPSSSRKNLPSRKNTLLTDMIESEVIENSFQLQCSSADLVNNQSKPCTISSCSTYSSVNS